MEFLNITSLLCLYAEVFGADLLRYVVGAGGVYVVVNLGLAARLARQKIRASGPVSGQIFRELMASLRTVAIFAAVGTLIGLGSRAGVIEIYDEIADYGFAYFAASIIVLIVAHDAWFYWSHRLLHHRALFRRLHKLHHRSHNPTPFTSYSFDVGEAVVNAVFLPLALLLLPAHPVALFVFVTHMILRNALGHCGIEVFPVRSNGKPLIGWLTSVTHHDLHHSQGRWNMGLYFTWWDRWMGTEHPDYHERFAAVAPRVSTAKFRIAALSFIVMAGLLAGRADAFELNGRYATPGLGAIIAFDTCANDPNIICARLAWAWEPEDMKGARVGDVLAEELTFDGTAWTGAMLSPENGWRFRGTLEEASPGALAVRGCAGPICVRQTWYSVGALRHILRE
ncbi:Fatty acid hydroxylase superfamily protein (plasmid) [Ruegeria sp. THAF33]|nr:Fatty acid hydroxylase superfamily protein [Ruegeria sp. THAF33]